MTVVGNFGITVPFPCPRTPIWMFPWKICLWGFVMWMQVANGKKEVCIFFCCCSTEVTVWWQKLTQCSKREVYIFRLQGTKKQQWNLNVLQFEPLLSWPVPVCHPISHFCHSGSFSDSSVLIECSAKIRHCGVSSILLLSTVTCRPTLRFLHPEPREQLPSQLDSCCPGEKTTRLSRRVNTLEACLMHM